MVKFAAREEMVGLEVGTTGRPTAGRRPATSSREGAVAAGPGSDGKGLGVDRLAGGPCRKMVRQRVRRSGLWPGNFQVSVYLFLCLAGDRRAQQNHRDNMNISFGMG